MATQIIPQLEIIQHLVLEAGRLMEDSSVELALRMPATREDQSTHLERLRQAAVDIVALGAAAEVLHRRGNA